MRPGTGTAVTLVVAAMAIVVAPAPARAADTTDADFVRRVHLTVLGLTPASALARDAGVSAAVKTVAARVGAEAGQLETLARTTATALKVSLAAPAPADQQAALATLQQHTGAVFDTDYVNYLWTVDSSLLPIATTVHATTKNAAVRKLAERAGAVTTEQLPLLAKTGLLHMAILPAPATKPPAKLPGGVPRDETLLARARDGDGFFRVRLIVLAGALGLGTFGALRLRTRQPRRRVKVAVAPADEARTVRR